VLQVECTNGDSESGGLAVLDVVMHACKTIVHSLTAQDRFSLVAYSTSAKVLLPLTAMDSNGVADAEVAINAMLANGQTNIWDGLLKGLEVLASEEADASRNKAVMLLTDGQPNIRPPRGEVGMMQQFMEGSDLMTTVSTFGFGYNLDSELLRGIATFGQGMYAFIPDGSFVGTVFVNATSNILSTAAREVKVTLKGLGLPDAAQRCQCLGLNGVKDTKKLSADHETADWSVQVMRCLHGCRWRWWRCCPCAPITRVLFT